MCEFVEQLILLDALNGDQAAVASKVAGMLPGERQALRDALAAVAGALGFDCATCGGIVAAREAVGVGPLGGPFSYYHQGHQPDRDTGAGQRGVPEGARS
jgi:hypothetical protein